MYRYGMKYRPYGIGCQPKKDIPPVVYDDPTGEYYNIVAYEEELSPEEVSEYELTPMAPSAS